MKPGRILIIQTASIGDVILATAMLESIHASYPETQIDMLVKKGMENLFSNHPFLGELLVWDKQEKKHRKLWSLIKHVRKNRYDVLINAHRFLNSGLITVLSGAKSKVGFRKNPLSFWFDHRVDHVIGNGTHEIERNHQLLQHLGNISLKRPKLYPDKAAEERVKNLCNQPCICISPASLWFTKQYPVDQWIVFIRQIPATYHIYLLGGHDDKSLCDQIMTAGEGKDVTNLAGVLSLLESAALMKLSRMNFVNDSAPMHLASAVNAPTKAIFCSTIPDFGFGPLSDEAVVIETKKTLKCRPCGLHGLQACPEGHFECAYSIDNQTLLKGI